MKPRKRATERFPLSNTGIAYLAGGAILFSAGMVRGELVSSICGCAILLYDLFCLACAAAGAWTWRKARFYLSWEGMDLANLTLAGTTQMPEWGGFFSTVSYESSFSVRPASAYVSPFKLSLPVTGPDALHRIAVPPRGIYHSDLTSIVIQDFSGFFRFSIYMPESMNPESLRVMPESDNSASLPLPPGRTGVSQGKSTFHRSDELYETRPYLPGDDPRKINWKVSAHTGSPVLREGELLPPPSTEYLFVFNTGTMDRKRDRADVKKNFDVLVSRATGIAQSLAAQNKIISVARLSASGDPAVATIRPGDPGAKEALLLAFAEPQPEQAVQSRAVETETAAGGLFDRNAAALLFTMPESVELPNLSSLSPKTTLIVCGPDLPSAREKEKLRKLRVRLSTGGFNVAQI